MSTEPRGLSSSNFLGVMTLRCGRRRCGDWRLLDEEEPLPSIRECLTHNHYLPASAAASVLVRMGDDSVLHCGCLRSTSPSLSSGCPACAGIDPNGHVRRGFRASYSTRPKAKHLAVAPGMSGFPAVNGGGRGCRLSLRRRSSLFQTGKRATGGAGQYARHAYDGRGNSYRRAPVRA